MAPQIILIAMFSADLGITIAMHGKPRDKFNALTTLIAIMIHFTILYFGGFWEPLIK